MNKNEKDKNKFEKIGGMALFNGLLLKNKKREVTIEKENGKIKVNISKISQNNNSIIYKIPIVRGVVGILNTIISYTPYIVGSAKEKIFDIMDEDIEINKVELGFGFTIAFSILIFAYIIIPNIIASFVPYNFQNILEASLQILLFFIYLLALKKSYVLQRLFEYHGAEHKVVNAYENLDMDNINLESVKKQSRFHRRCGGNFVIYVIMLSVISTLLITSIDLFDKTLIQIILLPFIIGISYEILIITSKFNSAFKYISYPAMFIQFFTTKEPTDDKIQIAIYALKGCVNEDNEMLVKKYIDSYIEGNIKNQDYDLNDILRIIAYVKKTSKEEVYININNICLTYQEQIAIDTLLNKIYKDYIPLQYILGKQSFYREIYIVNEDVLVPRADSEILVEKAIEYINNNNLSKMIDMCTGSGCIGISIAKNSCIKFGFLVDVSSKALEVAKQNIILNEVQEKVAILKSNLFDEFKNIQENKYDIVVSNPPYIKTSDIEKLNKNVKNEPLLALDGGKDGLVIYNKIFCQAKEIIADNGYLILEIGFDQLNDLKKIISRNSEYEFVESVKDLAGNDRVVVCRFHQL